MSDHHPVSFTANMDIIPKCTDRNNSEQVKVKWDKVSTGQIEQYRLSTSQMLQNIIVPDGVKCIDPNCKMQSHRDDIDLYYSSIADVLIQCGNCLKAKGNQGKHHVVPGWSENVDVVHNAARDAYLLWKDSGKTRQGAIYDLMKRSRAQFKYALRKCKVNKNTIIADKIANKMSGNNVREFWNEIKVNMNSRVNLPSVIDNSNGDEQITEMWQSHFEQVFNTVKESNCQGLHAELQSADLVFCQDMVVNGNEILDILKCIPNGKAAGLDGLSAEHIKYAGQVLPVMLSLFVSSVLAHGHIPLSLIKSTVVPIIKDKNKRIADKSNYRPICLSNVITKVIEYVLLHRLEGFLSTTGNQFGFKRNHGTELCVFTLKELIRYYITNGSQMFVAFLDASKAFDRVNHTKLLFKLKTLGVPTYLLRVIAYWYCNQSLCVRWGSVLSKFFNVTNGVRQGGILSPLFFNVYMNELSLSLNKIPVGCCCGNIVVNHLMYADDLVVCAPSGKGIQKLLNVCDKYGNDNDILYNVTKSQLMLFDTLKIGNNTGIKLGSMVMNYVSSYKYLGHIICNNLSDDEDIKSKLRCLYGRSNILLRKFYFCSKSVKHKLFMSYLSSVYLCSLWIKYSSRVYNSFRVAYNNAFRILLKLSPRCSASGMFTLARVNNCSAMFRNCFNSVRCRVDCSVNNIIVSLRNSDVFHHMSNMFKKRCYLICI